MGFRPAATGPRMLKARLALYFVIARVAHDPPRVKDDLSDKY
ncbi:MAG TPA: hypothetical protein VGH00_06310 [Chthoniobacterales bacterium]